MAMNYYQFVVRLGDALGDLQRDVNLPIIIPSAIDQAEQRLYRELQLLGTTVKDSTNATTATRDITLPSTASYRFVAISEVNVITPVGATPSTGTRNVCTRVSPRLMNFLNTVESSAGTPNLFTMYTDSVVTLGPAPSTNFTVEFVGTVRPAPLSSGNSSTYLASYLPDLFFSAAMASVCYSMGDKATPTYQYWDNIYQQELRSANMEEAKKKYAEYYTGNQPAAVQDRQNL